jgi:hypothetical protein
MPAAMYSKRRRLNCPTSGQHYVYMATRSKKSATDSNFGQSSTGKTPKERAQWTADDEAALVTFLLNHKPEEEDGSNFTLIWPQVAEEMNKRKTKGAEKTVESCKSKWRKVRLTTMIVVVHFLSCKQ